MKTLKEYIEDVTLQESIEKGTFHKWLGKTEDAPITQSDIDKGLGSSDPHVRKMAQFAKNMREDVETAPHRMFQVCDADGNEVGRTRAHDEDDATSKVPGGVSARRMWPREYQTNYEHPMDESDISQAERRSQSEEGKANRAQWQAGYDFAKAHLAKGGPEDFKHIEGQSRMWQAGYRKASFAMAESEEATIPQDQSDDFINDVIITKEPDGTVVDDTYIDRLRRLAGMRK